MQSIIIRIAHGDGRVEDWREPGDDEVAALRALADHIERVKRHSVKNG